MAGVGITGQVGVNLAQLRAKGQTLTDIDGQVDVVDLAWQFGNKRYLLGNFNLVARMEDGQIVGDVADDNGPVAAEGTVRVDPTARTWALDARVRPRSSRTSSRTAECGDEFDRLSAGRPVPMPRSRGVPHHPW